MSATTPFTPAQEERFAVLCAWCANGCNAHKDEQGQYVHFPDGRVKCDASQARKDAEPPRDRAWAAWISDRCPICGSLKRERQDWFCKMCFWKLPKDIQNALQYQRKGFLVQWIEAMAILKKARETNHG